MALLFIGVMIFMIGGKFKAKPFKINLRESKDLLIDEVYNKDCNEINVTSDCGNVYVKHSNNEQIRVIIYGNQNKSIVSSNLKSNILNISQKQKRGFNFLGFNTIMHKIEVYIPKEYKNNLNINNDYGDILVDSFIKANMDIRENCGNIYVKEGNSVIIDNDYGNINLDKAKIARLEESCGSIEVGEVYNIQAENDYGNIKVTKITNSLNLSNNCGDIKIDNLILNENSNINNDMGKIFIGSTNKIFFDAKTDLGKVKIENNYRKSNIELKLRNNCGDIIVNN